MHLLSYLSRHGRPAVVGTRKSLALSWEASLVKASTSTATSEFTPVTAYSVIQGTKIYSGYWVSSSRCRLSPCHLGSPWSECHQPLYQTLPYLVSMYPSSPGVD